MISHTNQDALVARAVQQSLNDRAMIDAALCLFDNQLDKAEPLLRARLKDNPYDVLAIRMLAELAARIGRLADSETLLQRALELAPGFGAARANLATILYKLNRPSEAIDQLDRLIDDDGSARETYEDVSLRNLKAAALSRIGGFDEAIALYETVLAKAKEQPKVWMSYAHILKTVGRTDEAITAYRQALKIAPGLGEVWWSLANLKTVSFDEADLNAMAQALLDQGLSEEDRFHLDFAMGKGLEDRGDYARSATHYQVANQRRRLSLNYDRQDISSHVDRLIDTFDQTVINDRSGGCLSTDPIFIVGMPRAGSTLIEQILSSHSLIEGTAELGDIPNLVRPYLKDPKAFLALSEAERTALGQDYIDRTRIQRKTDRPFFIDKLPNNWMHIAFIRLILPKAHIIDARRHPLGCCVSNFKQHFAKGQAFSYDLSDMGTYYADYTRLMAHVDKVEPLWVHRVFYEAMVDTTEAEVRRLLSFLKLEFEPACLNFHENKRAVRTASSEQVRQPINRRGVDNWQAFPDWIAPLTEALGPCLDQYPYGQ